MSGLSGECVRIAVREVHIENFGEGLNGLDGYGQALAVYRYGGSVIGRAFLPVRNGVVDGNALREPLSNFEWEIWLKTIEEKQAVHSPARTASVIVCTHDRTSDLASCLRKLLPVLDRGHEIIVVDSAPSTDDTAELVASFPHIRYVRETRSGAGLARNRGIAEARRQFVAFTDDDAQADSQWLESLLRNFDDELVAVVTGITMPIELETRAQFWFEKTNPFSRGFLRREFDLSNFDPLIAGVVGCSVNMAARVSALERIGTFDEVLGPGTIAQCGEDHEFYYRALRSGYRIVYDPAALVWHRHRRDWPALRRVINSYGVGVFAWWTGALFFDGEFGLFKVGTSWFLGHHLRNLWRSLVRRPDRVPLELAWAEFTGAIEGPFAYFRSYRDVRRHKAANFERRLPQVADSKATS